MRKPTRREEIKLAIQQGHTDDWIKSKYSTPQKMIDECKAELKKSKSIFVNIKNL